MRWTAAGKRIRRTLECNVQRLLCEPIRIQIDWHLEECDDVMIFIFYRTPKSV